MRRLSSLGPYAVSILEFCCWKPVIFTKLNVYVIITLVYFLIRCFIVTRRQVLRIKPEMITAHSHLISHMNSLLHYSCHCNELFCGLVIIQRPPYWPESESRANMGRGMITRPIWKCPCIKLVITYFRHLEKRHPYWPETRKW
jgi:hypothetical protein